MQTEYLFKFRWHKGRKFSLKDDKFKLIAHWINHNSLILNYDKTKFMFITNKHVNYPSSIIINSHTIEVVDSFVIGKTDTVIDIDVVDNIKLLGITIDNKLIFSNFFFKSIKKSTFLTILHQKTYLSSFEYQSNVF